MQNQSDLNNPKTSRRLSTGRVIALFAAICLLIGVTGAVSAALGEWISWGLTFTVTFLACITVSRKFSNPAIPNACGTWVGLVTVGTPAVKTIQGAAGEDLAAIILVIILGISVMSWMKFFHWFAKQNRSTQPTT